ncbi:MAG: hypothetical protein ABIW03_00740 [Sphingomicrobium sp.]
MRAFQLIVPLVLMASPALAQVRPAPPPETITVPPELTDPATADRIGGMMQSLSKALLNLPVGEIEAAAQGRPVTQADRRETVRDLGRKQDPNFERNLDRDLAASRGAMQSGMKAFSTALPAVLKSLAEAGRAIEQATANLPSPVYPRR